MALVGSLLLCMEIKCCKMTKLKTGVKLLNMVKFRKPTASLNEMRINMVLTYQRSIEYVILHQRSNPYENYSSK